LINNFFLFSDNPNEGTDNAMTPEVMGFKAYNLMRLSKIGLPVPPGFVIPTKICHEYYYNNKHFPLNFNISLQQNIQKLEQITGLTFGGSRKPLLVSVRSGAAVSMPGMMNTILNVGLSHITIEGLLRMTGNPRFIWDLYRRFIQNFAEVVYNCHLDKFNNLLVKYLKEGDLDEESDLDVEMLKKIVNDYLEIFEEQTGVQFPQQPIEQLQKAIKGIFFSWQSPRCMEYRKIHNIGNLLGTAATVQAMVFGNMGITSGAGVAFTRNPSSGENKLYGEFLFNTQGEDIVSGRRTPQGLERLGELLPNIRRQLNTIAKRLEIEFTDMQDFEFTVQEGNLFILQTRNGKRTPWAALQIVFDMVQEGLVSKDIALNRLKEYNLQSIKRTKILSNQDDTSQYNTFIGFGLPASPGIAIGKIVFNSKKAKELTLTGESTILICHDISTEDIGGIAVCEGILTKMGGKTSHASVVSRQMNKVCIVGCTSLKIDTDNKRCTIGNSILYESDYISLDGNTGKIYNGKISFEIEKPEKILSAIQQWKEDYDPSSK